MNLNYARVHISILRFVLDLSEFKGAAEVIVANRMTDDLADSVEKVFTRDLFNDN